jgi:hypothetical protein
MGAIQATRDLGDEKTTTDKAKIFSKNCFDTGSCLQCRFHQEAKQAQFGFSLISVLSTTSMSAVVTFARTILMARRLEMGGMPGVRVP